MEGTLDEGLHSGLLPATVEQLAAGERTDSAPRRRVPRRGLFIFLVTGLLLASGSVALALGRQSPAPLMVEPAPGIPTYVDGFGGAPSPSPSPSPSKRPRPTAFPTPSRSPLALVSVNAGTLSASIQSVYWDGGMWVQVVITNRTSKPANWVIELVLSPEVEISPLSPFSVEPLTDRIRLRPTQGPLAAGKSVWVEFFGSFPPQETHRVQGCFLNGVRCASPR